MKNLLGISIELCAVLTFILLSPINSWAGSLQGFDENYYLSAKLAALQATDSSWNNKTTSDLAQVLTEYGLSAESHYSTYGYLEGLEPNQYFNHSEYITAKATAMYNAGGYASIQDAENAFNDAWTGDAYQHYIQFGAAEGVSPSNSFDETAYLTDKLALLQEEGNDWDNKTITNLRDFLTNAGMTALTHYLNFGQYEGLTPKQISTSPSTIVGLVGDDYTLLAWNDLGMHCMDGVDYSVFSILPPFNNLHAQLIRKQGTSQKLITSGVTVTYEAVADANGSINTSSATPSNYWDFVSQLYEPLFGPTPAVDVGLLGNPTQSRTPAQMGYNDSFGWWEAEGIPTDPYNDYGVKDFYPLVKVVARDLSGNTLAETTTVLPVSDEMDCRTCHASGSPTSAMPAVGWVSNSDSEKDYKLNILRLHDERHDITPYLSTLTENGFIYTASLYETSQGGTPILCSSCHGSNALPGTGVDGIVPLTTSLHSTHAEVIDPETYQRLDDSSNRTACYRCHPGAETQCLRGAMGAATAPDNTSLMSCQNCHGSMMDVGTDGRVGWLDEPNCQGCHFETKRLLEVDAQSMSDPADNRFATNIGTDLFRFSKGHGGLQCEACHGATHAIYPSAEPNDNIQSLALQGHIGTIAECNACHSSVPFTVDKGPHGLHTVGQDWVNRHEDTAERSVAQCSLCHGDDFKGTDVSKTSMERTFQVEGRSKTFIAGHSVGCYDCHNGPGGGDD